ncbi:hypothetical protein DEH84_14215 [Aquabacterium olei]|uniref:Uncharacterized protein n=1 Tax=Aquabacterium olei TaxID=1296669 RepID=A0A2U8FTV8_9BURK|nr:hypothetical protein DEH84_14215 [Aquabacterium olei]
MQFQEAVVAIPEDDMGTAGRAVGLRSYDAIEHVDLAVARAHCERCAQCGMAPQSSDCPPHPVCVRQKK